MSDRRWKFEAEVAGGIRRIRADDGETAWFVVADDARASCDEYAHDERGGAESAPPRALTAQQLADEAEVFAGAEALTVSGESGLRVPRCAGGMLAPFLDGGALTVAEALGIAVAVLDAVIAAPPAPEGRTRVTRAGLALSAVGEVVVLPGRHAPIRTPRPALEIPGVRPRDTVLDPTASVEFAEIVHAAVTGRFWAPDSAPVGQTMDGAPRHLVDLVATLLDGEEIGDLGRLREALSALGAEPLRRFAPAEPGVAVDEQPTGVIRADVIAALREAPTGASGTRDGAAASPRAERSADGRAAREGIFFGGTDGEADEDAVGTKAERSRDAAARFRRTALARGARTAAAQTGSGRAEGSDDRTRRRRGSRASDRRRAGERKVRAPGSPSPVRRALDVLGQPRTGMLAAAALSAVVAGGLLLTGQIPHAAGESTGADSSTSQPDREARAAAHAESEQAGAVDDAGAGEDPATAFAQLSERRSAALAAHDREALAALTVPDSPAAAADAALDLGSACTDCSEVGVREVRAVEDDGGSAVVTAEMATGDGAWTPVRIELRLHAGDWRVWSVGA